MTPKTIAIVILNWNGKKMLETFLPSIVHNNLKDVDIIVADNASTDDSILFVKNIFPQIKIIQNTENGGFAKGYNDALKLVKSDYYILLNSDVEVTPNWIQPFLEILDKHPETVAIQPKILSYINKTEFEYAGGAGGFIDKYGYPFCRGRIFQTIEKDEKQYDNEQEIFWASGACLFIKSLVFHELGGFDEDFFAHMEEIDLCWRIKNAGYKIMYCPTSTVYHLGGGTLHKNNPQKTYLNFRNNLFILFKNHSSRFFYPKIIIRLTLDGIAGIKFLLEGETAHFIAVIKAHFHFYGSLKKLLEKRKITKKNTKKYATSCIYRHSVVYAYYVKKRKKFFQLDFTD
ncbi:MAG TPA: glycosyltransferase family 2 protein [Bacteroidia bacterium]|nr:glycosyltransferase family 2 protein [Bacteroidia bacterium]